MTVRVERVVTVPTRPKRVWQFIADPENRARAISVVVGYDLDDPDGHAATWRVTLPIPGVDRTIAVTTEDVERHPPEYVEFVGRSTAFRVTGEHAIEATEEGSRLTNRFVVEGRVPGVERFFTHTLDDELEALERALRAALAADGDPAVES